VNVFAPIIRRPIGTSLLAIGLTIAGFCAYLLLGVAALPSLDFPGLVVIAQYPGADAQTMAATVVAPLERQLGRIPDIQEMDSDTNAGGTQIRILFNFGRPSTRRSRTCRRTCSRRNISSSIRHRFRFC
jgi:multidrug efflux pump